MSKEEIVDMIKCGLDEQQCQQECQHKTNRRNCPFVTVYPKELFEGIKRISKQTTMNEITAAIAKKAFERYGSGSNHAAMSYIAGGEDAIGFMLKFVEWMCKNGYDSIQIAVSPRWSKGFTEESYTTEQLLLKYMESEQEK